MSYEPVFILSPESPSLLCTGADPSYQLLMGLVGILGTNHQVL